MGTAGYPVWLLALALIGVPVGIAVFFGLFAFRDLVPLAYRCRRCDAVFTRAAHRAFPSACPRCRSREWNC